MRFDLLIQNGTVCSSTHQEVADIGIVGNRIHSIGSLGSFGSERTLDASGLHVLPGVIDTQVHFREPGLTQKEDLESGSRAAVMGGVTTYFEMPNTVPTTTTKEALESKLAAAEGRSWANYGFFIGAATDNLDELAANEMLPGSPGIKIFMGSSTGSLLVSEDADLRVALRNGKRRFSVHAEDEPRLRELKAKYESEGREKHPRDHPHVRDAEAARLATERILRLSHETGRPVHVLHVSTADELPLIAEAKCSGWNNTAEVTPQHLTLSAPDCYDRLGTLAQMNPPVRTEEHRMAIWAAVKAGLFDVLGSDHAPHTLEEKARPYPKSPSGMPGVQTLLPVMLNWVNQGEMPLGQLIAMACENPCALFGIANKGRLQESFDADIAIIDLKKSWTIENKDQQSKCSWTPFNGMQVMGKVIHTIVQGHVAVQDSVVVGRPSGSIARYTWKSS